MRIHAMIPNIRNRESNHCQLTIKHQTEKDITCFDTFVHVHTTPKFLAAANRWAIPSLCCTPQSLQSGSRFHIGPGCIPWLSISSPGLQSCLSHVRCSWLLLFLTIEANYHNVYICILPRNHAMVQNGDKWRFDFRAVWRRTNSG